MAPLSWLISQTQGVLIDIHAQPGAKRSAVVGEYGSRLKIAVSTPPVDGKANAALIIFFSKNTVSVKIFCLPCLR